MRFAASGSVESYGLNRASTAQARMGAARPQPCACAFAQAHARHCALRVRICASTCACGFLAPAPWLTRVTARSRRSGDARADPSHGAVTAQRRCQGRPESRRSHGTGAMPGPTRVTARSRPPSWMDREIHVRHPVRAPRPDTPPYLFTPDRGPHKPVPLSLHGRRGLSLLTREGQGREERQRAPLIVQEQVCQEYECTRATQRPCQP